VALRRSARRKASEAGTAALSKVKGGSSSGEGAGESVPAGPLGRDFEKLIEVDVFALEIGFNLLGLADKRQGGDLLERVTGVRRTIAKEMGIVVPPIAVRDNLELDSNEYRFLLRDREVARGKVVPKRLMAMNVSQSTVELRGIPTVEPVFGIEAVWITEEERKTAELNGFSIVDPCSVLVTHLS
jgi:flagellar biosynthesis protein FlhA